MSSIKKDIPNIITSLNLLSGVAAIILCLSFGELEWAAFFIFLGAVFDFFDGLVARALGVSSPIGADLDSLADVVSFGVAPSILLFQATWNISCCPWGAGFALLIGAFAAFRLAKFNNDTRQTTSFIGLPVPANAIFWIGFSLSLPMLKEVLGAYPLSILTNLSILVIGYLMISEVPMFSFKVKKISFFELRYQIALVMIAVLSFIFLDYLGLSITILAYILLSILQNALETKAK